MHIKGLIELKNDDVLAIVEQSGSKQDDGSDILLKIVSEFDVEIQKQLLKLI